MLTKQGRIIFGVLAILAAIGLIVGLCGGFFDAAAAMNEWGAQMADLRSESGNSVAEYYYRYQGWIYMGQSGMYESLGAIIIVFGVFIIIRIVRWIRQPEQASAPSNQGDVRAASSQIKCPKCGNITDGTGAGFCTQCGSKLS